MSQSKINSIAKRINTKLANLHKTSIEVGQLLAEAKELHDNQKEFLKWAGNEFGLGKAWTYKLIKVADTFGGDDRFQGVASSVLYAIASQASEEIIEACAVLAENGELDIKAFKALMVKAKKEAEASNPAPVQPSKASSKAVAEVVKQLDAQSEKVAEVAATESEKPPFDTEPSKTSTEESSELTALREQNEKLLNRIAELTEQVASMNKPKAAPKAEAPALPHFTSKNKAIRLGLTPTQARDEATIRKVYRELVKAGYSKGHECYESITNAKDELLAKIK